MKATVRARLTIGFLALVTIGSVASVAILAILSGTIDELKRVGPSRGRDAIFFYLSLEHPFRTTVR